MMSRAPFQILVLPYRTVDGVVLYALFRRFDGNYWQWIAGGGEDGESPIEAAKREAFEEAGIGSEGQFVALDSLATIPVERICGFIWGPNILVVPEYCFAVMTKEDLGLSQEHTEFMWTDYESASKALKWDSNRNALWELNHRLSINK
jgi:dihydroneopterin triphosphate diphosphatase